MERTITIPACVDRLDEVFGLIDEVMTSTGTDTKTQNNIRIAVEEIFVNIASYAYPENGGEVVVSVSAAEDRLVIEFADSGTPYDPLAKADPDTTLTADERDIGGLGIFMVKKMMDNVEYRYEDGKNILTIEKIVNAKEQNQ